MVTDPTDNRVLEAAQEGDAEVIVSGDRHLLRLGAWEGIQIVKPADFLATPGSTPRGAWETGVRFASKYPVTRRGAEVPRA